MFNYITSEVVQDERFSEFFTDEIISSMNETKTEIDDGIAQLQGDNYSRLIITTTLPEESDETTGFFDKLTEDCDSKIGNDYYLISNSSMAYEMAKTFDAELLKITLITALAIFLVVALSFRSFSIPLVLVLLIQCSVFTLTGLIGIKGDSIYYLALLVVQSILMGATIDYAILYTSYYRENRLKLGVRDSIKEAYKGSIHTVLTSGLVIITVAGILGKTFEDPAIGQICSILSLGSICALVLIVFVLPGILAGLDKFVCRNPKYISENISDTSEMKEKVICQESMMTEEN